MSAIHHTMIKWIEQNYTQIFPTFFFIGSIITCYRIGKWNRANLYPGAPKEELDQKETTRFLKLFEEPNHRELSVNSNIHPDLYCYEKMVKMMEEKHEEENKWKTRVLLENTPYGNVVMFYDLYKQAFAYFSDTQLSYKWLNMCAMKYVRTFFCRDFFTDTQKIPETMENPFNRMKIDEEEKEKQKKKKKKDALNLDLQSDVFIRKKQKRTEDASVRFREPIAHTPIQDKFVNNFRHMGKIQNCALLQKSKITQPKKNIPLPCHNDNPESDLSIEKGYQYIQFKRQKHGLNGSFL